MNELATELLHKVTYSGWLRQSDILSLCCASQTISEKLLGDDYGKNYFKSLLGARVCAQYKCWDAARYALLNGNPFTDDIAYLLLQTGHAWTLGTQRLLYYLLKHGYNDKVSTENLTVVGDWHSEAFKKICLNQDFANIDGSHIANAVTGYQ